MSRYRLKDMREDRDLLQKDLAKLLNTTQQHYSRIENGDTEISSYELQMFIESEYITISEN